MKIANFVSFVLSRDRYQRLIVSRVVCNFAKIHNTFIAIFIDSAVVYRQNIGLMIDRARVKLSPGPLQATSNKLLAYCVLNSASYPQRDGK